MEVILAPENMSGRLKGMKMEIVSAYKAKLIIQHFAFIIFVKFHKLFRSALLSFNHCIHVKPKVKRFCTMSLFSSRLSKN